MECRPGGNAHQDSSFASHQPPGGEGVLVGDGADLTVNGGVAPDLRLGAGPVGGRSNPWGLDKASTLDLHPCRKLPSIFVYIIQFCPKNKIIFPELLTFSPF